MTASHDVTAPPAPEKRSLLRRRAAAGVRPEIQALRAVAVGMVIIVHLWPERLPGGYAGVDVFFVISGFLITAHLVREINRTGTISLRQFWARRARRLLPASLLVLLASAIAVLLFVPKLLWIQFLREIGAATVYILNWVLAGDAVDYLAANNVESPAQHYWSLSVEEQFYIVWPLLILIGIFFAARSKRLSTKTAIAVLLSALVVLSLSWSIYLTATDAASAYFVTTTRAWEFGVGGLLALFAASPIAGRENLRSIVSWFGVAAIAATALFYTAETPFPGYTALLPVLGTVAVIWAGTPSRWWSPTTLGSIRPIQWFGDVSYSAYLWHWPPIVIVPYIIGYDLNWKHKLAILAFTLVAAAISKKFIEDPVRTNSFLVSRKPRWTLVATAVAMVAVLAIPVATYASVQGTANEQRDQETAIAEDPTICFGAEDLDPDKTCSVLPDTLLPDPALVAEDRPEIYSDECRSQPDDDTVRECVFGDKGAATRVALIGDSHSASWFPALELIAEKQGWELTTVYKASCPFTAPAEGRDLSESCTSWNAKVQEQLATEDPFDIVFTAFRASGNDGLTEEDAAFSAAVGGFQEAWAPLQARGAQIVGFHDNPIMTDDTPQCVSENIDDSSVCNLPESKTLTFADPLFAAAEQTDGAVAINMNDYFIVDGETQTIVGQVVVWRDEHHFTATYSKSFVQPLTEKLAAAGVL